MFRSGSVSISGIKISKRKFYKKDKSSVQFYEIFATHYLISFFPREIMVQYNINQ